MAGHSFLLQRYRSRETVVKPQLAYVDELAAGLGAEPFPDAAGSPWENRYIESFHGRLRDEFLERVEFEDVADARANAFLPVTTDW